MTKERKTTKQKRNKTKNKKQNKKKTRRKKKKLTHINWEDSSRLKANLELGRVNNGLTMGMYVQSNKPSKQSTKGIKLALNQICPLHEGGYKNKQTRGKTHAQLTLRCILSHCNEERSIGIRYIRLPGPWGRFCTSETGLPPRTRCLGKLHRRIKLTSHEHKTWLLLECLHTSTPDLYINKKQTWLKLMDKRRTEQVYIL